MQEVNGKELKEMGRTFRQRYGPDPSEGEGMKEGWLERVSVYSSKKVSTSLMKSLWVKTAIMSHVLQEWVCLVYLLYSVVESDHGKHGLSLNMVIDSEHNTWGYV